MKAQQKNLGLCLQKKNNRWRWMAGATALTAAGVSASQASTITINLLNNYIGGGGGGNHLNADLTGDGHPDLTIANTYGGAGYYYAGVILNGVQAFCHYNADYLYLGNFVGFERLGERFASYQLHYGNPFGTYSLMGSIPIFFKDLHFNGGAPTEGSLEVTVTPYQIQLDSLTYTTNTPANGSRIAAVSDQGSSLALMAMGAGGILALRRLRTAQARS